MLPGQVDSERVGGGGWGDCCRVTTRSNPLQLLEEELMCDTNQNTAATVPGRHLHQQKAINRHYLNSFRLAIYFVDIIKRQCLDFIGFMRKSIQIGL